MKAVATMTPEPKYLAMKKAHSGTPTPRCRSAKTGNTAPGSVVLALPFALRRWIREERLAYRVLRQSG